MVSATRRRLCNVSQELRLVELENLRLRAENDKLLKWQNSAACAAFAEDGKYTGDHLTMAGDGSRDGHFRSSLRGQDKPPPPPSQQSASQRPERPKDRPRPPASHLVARQEPESGPTTRPSNWYKPLAGEHGFASARQSSGSPFRGLRGHKSPRNDQSPEGPAPVMGHGADRPCEAMRYRKAHSAVRPSARSPWDRPPPKVTLGKAPRLGRPGVGSEAQRPQEGPRHLAVNGCVFESRSTPASPSHARHQQHSTLSSFENQMPERTDEAVVAAPDVHGGAPFVLGFVNPDTVAKLNKTNRHRGEMLEQRRKEKVRQLSRYEPPPRWSPTNPSLSEIEALHGEPVRNTVRCRFSGSVPSDVFTSRPDWAPCFKDAFVLLLAIVLETTCDKVHISVFVKDSLVLVSVTVEVPGSADKVAASLRESLESGELNRKASEKLPGSKEPDETLKEFFCSRVQLMTLLLSERHEWNISELKNQIVLHGGSSCLESPSFGLSGCGDLVLQMHPHGTRTHGTRSGGRVALHLCAPALDLPTFSFVLTIGATGSGERWIGPFGRFGSRFVPGGAVCSQEDLLELVGQNGSLTIGVEAVGQHLGSNSAAHSVANTRGEESSVQYSTKASTQLRVPLSDSAIYKLGLQADHRQKIGIAFKDAEDRAVALVSETKAIGRGLEELALRCKEHTDASLVACGLAGPQGQGNMQQQVDDACDKAEQCKQSLATVLEDSTALKSTVQELRLAGATDSARVSALEGVVEQLRATPAPDFPDDNQSQHAAASPEIPDLDELRQQSQTTAEQVTNLDGTVDRLKQDVLSAQSFMDQELSVHTRGAEELRQEVREFKDLVQQEREQSAKALEALETETAEKIRMLEEQAENAAANAFPCSEVQDRIAALEQQVSNPVAASVPSADERDERIAALEAEVLALKELTMAAATAALPAPDTVPSAAAAAPPQQVVDPASSAPTAESTKVEEAIPAETAAGMEPAETAAGMDAPTDAKETAPGPEEVLQETEASSPDPQEKVAVSPDPKGSEAAETDDLDSLAESDNVIMDGSIQAIIRMEDVEPPHVTGSSVYTESHEDDRSLCSDFDSTLLEEASGEVGAFLSPRARDGINTDLDAALGLLPPPSEMTEQDQEDDRSLCSDADNTLLEEASGEEGAFLSPRARGSMNSELDAALGLLPAPSEITEDWQEDRSEVDVDLVPPTS